MSMIEIPTDLLLKQATELLAGNGSFSSLDAQTELHNGRLILRGTVKTFYHKQLAQETLRGFAKANSLRIENNLDVLEDPST
ncbi:MAG: BON domain-containing protein [Pirellulales bacterium]